MSLIEVLVSVGLLSIAAFALVKVFDISLSSKKNIELLTQRTQLLDLASNMLENRASWAATVNNASSLRHHLESSANSATTGWSNMALHDASGALYAKVGGSYLNSALEPSTQEAASWFISARWRGRTFNRSDVEVLVEPVEAGARLSSGRRYVRALNRKVRDRCVTLSAPILATSTHGKNGPFRYDSASVTCPANHILMGIDITPGCGAVHPRTLPDLANESRGLCYQISYPTSEWGTLGCNAGNVAGTCEVTCCVFD